MDSTIHCRVLRKAAEVLGGNVKLSRELQVPGPVLRRWLLGTEMPTTHAFLRSVDLLVGAGTSAAAGAAK